MGRRAQRLAGLPTGIVTFLFTDIESSTLLIRLWGEETYARALKEHFAILRDALSRHDGFEVDTEGDALFAVFADAAQAVGMALAAQVMMVEHVWPVGAPLRVRMGLHTGEARCVGDAYVGLAVHQAARVASAAHGGQVVASASTVNAAGSLEGGACWLGLGRHRLKDLGSPVELSQLGHPVLGSEFPPLRSLERVAHNLPVQLSSFWGRAEELALGSKLLASARLMTITGAGGSGKTRLAYQLAAEAITDFPDGVWVAELTAVADPALVPNAVMGALGLRDEPLRSATETVVSHLAGRRALLVLDNCEHVIEAAAELAAAVLSGCPQVRAMATSREPLHLPGETVWALGPLTLPSASEDRATILATADAVGLFCERAAEAQVGFSLDDGNAGHVVEICRHLEGIPLALELAAARLRTLPIAELSRRLSTDLGLLSKGPRRAHSRQSSLQATLDWSYQLLSANEQALFRHLAVFAGGFTLSAADAVCAGEDPEGDCMDALDGLVDKSLVSLGVDQAGEGRYRLLEPVRAYARQRLVGSGELDLVNHRHASFFARLASEASQQASSGTSLPAWETEHPNFLAALDCLAQSRDASAHGRLAIDLWAFWNAEGHLRIGAAEYRRYLARPDPDPHCRIACARYLGNLASYMGDLAEARHWHAQALSLARELGDRRAEAICLRNCGNDSFFEGDFAQAHTYYGEALVIARELGDRVVEGRCAGGLGMAAAGCGDWRTAWSCYSEALQLAQETGDREFERSWLNNRGEAAVALGKYDGAKEDLLRALRMADESRAIRTQITTHDTLGALATNMGDYSGALEHHKKAQELARLTGERREEAWAEGGLGVVSLKRGAYTQAGQHFAAAVELARQSGENQAQGHWLTWFGILLLEQGDLEGASACCADALNLCRAAGNRDTESYVLALEGELAARTGNLRDAQERFRQALRITTETGRRGLQSQLQGKLSDVAAKLDDIAEARSLIRRALSLAIEIGEQDDFLLEVAASVLSRSGQFLCSAELLAAADAINGSRGKKRSTWDQARYDDALARCTAGLGSKLTGELGHIDKLEWATAVKRALSALEGP